MEPVVVLGASANPERYSNKAVRALLTKGYHVIPVHPKEDMIEELPVVHSLRDVSGPVDTVSVYVSPHISSSLKEAFLQLNPGRVIFNPGAENPDLENALSEAGIAAEDACTLVMLQTGEF